MKTVDLEQASMESCIREAQCERVVITRNGKPVALIIGVEGMDEEQLELSSSDRFWSLALEWRKQKTLTRAELDERIRQLTGEETE